MKPHIFRWLASYLRTEGLIEDSILKVEEKLAFFLYMISHNASFQDLQLEFQHSNWTFQEYIKEFFNIIPILATQFVRPRYIDEPHPKIAMDDRFFPYFENCIGAIDGSHVAVTRTPHLQALWRNRKGSLSQNVMIAWDFDLNITFISCGWEGSATDARVLSSAILKGFKVPNGKFYLVDGGYAKTQSFLAPYRGVRYHLKEWGMVAVGHKITWNYLISDMRASWNLGLEKALVDILHEHNTTYYRSQNGWSSETWNKMVNLFHARHTYVQFTKSQIQDKEKDLKRDYRMLKDARTQSGVGWNESKFMIEAEPHLWDNLEISFGQRIRRFKSKAFPLYDSLGQLYEGSIATCNLNFTSTPMPDVIEIGSDAEYEAEKDTERDAVGEQSEDELQMLDDATAVQGRAQVERQEANAKRVVGGSRKEPKNSPKKRSANGIVQVMERLVHMK